MQNYLTLTQVRAKLGNRSRSAIYVDIAAGRLPQPIKFGHRVYWPENDLDAYLRSMLPESARQLMAKAGCEVSDAK